MNLRTLAIREKALGPNNPDTAASLNHLAQLYDAQGKAGPTMNLQEQIGQLPPAQYLLYLLSVTPAERSS